MAEKTDQVEKSGLYGWFENRLGLNPLVAFLSKKTVPIHKNTIWYYFGGISLFLLILQVITGILLLLYYRASAEQAYESVKFIVTQVNFGWLIRSLHSWCANLLILAVFIHLFSAFLMKAYRPPRELTWITGVMMFFLMVTFGFTGYLLPWNELALAATKVGTEIAGSVPVVGEAMKEFLRGGEEVTGATLTRMFGFHVAILPSILTILLGVHLYLVQKQGMSEPLSWNKIKDGLGKKRHMKFFPNFFYRDVLAWMVALWVLAAIASLFPWELGAKADLFAPTPANVKPEWYFMFMFVTLEGFHFNLFGNEISLILDKSIVISLFGVLAGLLMFVPFLDRKARKGEKSPLFTGIGWFSIIYIIVTTIVGFVD